MEAMASYIRTLCCGALICAVILSVSGTKGPGGALRRMLCGMLLAVLAISPLRKLDFGAFMRDYSDFSKAAETAAASGRRQAEKLLDARISDGCRSYILDQARSHACSVDAEVEIDPGTHRPRSVTVIGRLSAETQQLLSEKIVRGLGVERSRQQWKLQP